MQKRNDDDNWFFGEFPGRSYLIDRDLITKKDGFKFNFRSGSGVVREKGNGPWEFARELYQLLCVSWLNDNMNCVC
jgi:hypothetical protein